MPFLLGDFGRYKDFGQLELRLDGVTRTFNEWTNDFVDTYYPNIGKSCYRVPAVHFNQQTLRSDKTFKGLLLNPPNESKWKGDLAHSLVLEKLEHLGHQLVKDQKGPLFIISSLDFENYLAKVNAAASSAAKPKGGGEKGKKGLRKTSDSFTGSGQASDYNSPSCSPAGSDARDEELPRQKPTGQLPPRPADMGFVRGELDVILLHSDCGAVLVEVKSTGLASASWRPTSYELSSVIRDSVQKAVKQVERGRDAYRFIMADLSCPPCVRLVVALPFVTKQQLDKALVGCDFDVCFLTKDDLRIPDYNDVDMAAEVDANNFPGQPDSLLQWWRTNLGNKTNSLSVEDLKTVVGRMCGLLSIVSVWTQTKPRIEVRTTAQAVNESANRFSHVVLLPRQAALLAQPFLTRVCLTGPMGSGKTLMLQLKGRQWLKEGRRVVVLNTRRSGRGRPIGHVLEEAIKKGYQGHQAGIGTVERHDVALNGLEVENFKAELEKKGPTERICFLLDELFFGMFYILELLATLFPHCPIWCVALLIVENLPDDFRCFRFDTVLRCPPSVQLLLKELDLNQHHRGAYCTRSAISGLPCDGPPIIFIEHQKHDRVRRPFECVLCAQQLSDVLQKQLGLVFPVEGGATESNRSLQPAKRSSAPLTFRDVFLLVCLPLAYYKYHGNNRWETTVKNVVQFVKYLIACPFFATLKKLHAPLKLIIDNTSHEIAKPLKDEIVVTDVMGVQSLERKVVIFVPGGPPFNFQDDVDKGDGDPQEQLVTQQSPEFSSIVSLTSGEERSGPCETTTSQRHEDRDDSNRLTLPGPAEQCIYQLVKEKFEGFVTGFGKTAKKGESVMLMKSIFDNMMGSTVEKCHHRETIEELFLQDDHLENGTAKLRMGMTIRGDLPVFDAVLNKPGSGIVPDRSISGTLGQLDRSIAGAMPDKSVSGTVPNRSVSDAVPDRPVSDAVPDKPDSGAVPERPFSDAVPDRPDSGAMPERPVSGAVPDRQGVNNVDDGRLPAAEHNVNPKTVSAKSIFFLPQLEEDTDVGNFELNRIRHALSSLSQDDQDWLFLAAARCLSQLIVVIP